MKDASSKSNQSINFSQVSKGLGEKQITNQSQKNFEKYSIQSLPESSDK